MLLLKYDHYDFSQRYTRRLTHCNYKLEDSYVVGGMMCTYVGRPFLLVVLSFEGWFMH